MKLSILFFSFSFFHLWLSVRKIIHGTYLRKPPLLKLLFEHRLDLQALLFPNLLDPLGNLDLLFQGPQSLLLQAPVLLILPRHQFSNIARSIPHLTLVHHHHRIQTADLQEIALVTQVPRAHLPSIVHHM